MGNKTLTWADGGLSQADGWSEGRTTTITVNTFAKRHTADSKYSHFSGSEDELLHLVADNWGKAKPGYRAGVILIPVEPRGFFTSVSKLEEGSTLVGTFEARRKGEKPRKTLSVVGGSKMPAKSVDIVLYSTATLMEGDDNELPNGDIESWEIISINASPDTFEAPINPSTLMHNHFGSDGGTKTNLTDEQFVAKLRDSFIYWSDKALLCEVKEN